MGKNFIINTHRNVNLQSIVYVTPFSYWRRGTFETWNIICAVCQIFPVFTGGRYPRISSLLRADIQGKSSAAVHAVRYWEACYSFAQFTEIISNAIIMNFNLIIT